MSEVVRFCGKSSSRFLYIAIKSIDGDSCSWYSVTNDTLFVHWNDGWDSEVIGHSTIKAEDATEAQLKALYDQYDVKTGKKKVCPDKAGEYVPKVGDVVEFEYNGEKLKAIVYHDSYHGISTIDNTSKVSGEGFFRTLDRLPSQLRKIGVVDVSNAGDYNKVRKIAKVYFSTPTFTGTYAERQKQWVEHHGIKAGSKVKVVRKFERDKDGYEHAGWDYQPSKAAMQGAEAEVLEVRLNAVRLKCGLSDWWLFPYFVLEPV